jgi:hypothetical protein
MINVVMINAAMINHVPQSERLAKQPPTRRSGG